MIPRKLPVIIALLCLAVVSAMLVENKHWEDLAELWLFTVLGYAYARWGG